MNADNKSGITRRIADLARIALLRRILLPIIFRPHIIDCCYFKSLLPVMRSIEPFPIGLLILPHILQELITLDLSSKSASTQALPYCGVFLYNPVSLDRYNGRRILFRTWTQTPLSLLKEEDNQYDQNANNFCSEYHVLCFMVNSLSRSRMPHLVRSIFSNPFLFPYRDKSI